MKITVVAIKRVLFICGASLFLTNFVVAESKITDLDNRLSIPIEKEDVIKLIQPKSSIDLVLFLAYVDWVFRSGKTPDDIARLILFSTQVDGAFSEGIFEGWKAYIPRHKQLFKAGYIRAKIFLKENNKSDEPIKDFRDIVLEVSTEKERRMLIKLML